MSDLQLDYELNLEQLTENIESNISILKMPPMTENGQEILEAYRDMKSNGASFYEMQLLYEDIMLELKKI
ncbi:hypothetical protein [Staphylococcus chromogenes]|uniref:hypothetical protein n=1 Tax=Staphylococcus chromogenes TaxID=46126 RepID=UPI00188EF2A6|nr:hypothetical protein [Staphylococcus chromogenes]HDF3152095.1 hypothetical protein [Staphylococcus aureus]